MDDRQVMADPGFRFGEPRIGGISTSMVADMYVAEQDLDTVADDYDLIRSEVLRALWFEAVHGDRPGWRVWAEDAARVLGGWDKARTAADLEPPDPDVGGVDLVDVVHPDGTHVYWSTHCRHGHHGLCRLTCKHCSAPCQCPCGHEENADA